MLALYIHLVWTTWDRLPLITTAIERPAHRSIAQEIVRCGCKVLALNGTEDHVHLLVAFSSTTDVATVVKYAKGVSSRFVNDAL
jgi:REP element-mobilizing transposase RayT